MKSVPIFQRVVWALWTIAFSLLVALALPAEAQPLTPSEIESLKTQLLDAQSVYATLGARVDCYADSETRFQTRSFQLQETAGDLKQREQEMSAELQAAESEAAALRREFEQSEREMGTLQLQINRIENGIRIRQAELDRCKSDWGVLGFLCDLAGEISGLNKDLRRLSADRSAAAIRVRSAQQRLEDAETRKNTATGRFETIREASDETKQKIAVIEAEIKLIKASLAEIRVVDQAYAVELGNFEDAFAEFDRLDPGSDRRFVIHRLRSESQNLEDHLVKARALLDENGLQLPGGVRICAV